MIMLNETGLAKAWQLKDRFDGDAGFKEYALRDISNALGEHSWPNDFVSDIAVVADAKDGGLHGREHLLLIKTNRPAHGSTRHAFMGTLDGARLRLRPIASGRYVEDIKKYAALQDYDQVIILYSDTELPEKMPDMLNEDIAVKTKAGSDVISDVEAVFGDPASKDVQRAVREMFKRVSEEKSNDLFYIGVKTDDLGEFGFGKGKTVIAVLTKYPRKDEAEFDAKLAEFERKYVEGSLGLKAEWNPLRTSGTLKNAVAAASKMTVADEGKFAGELWPNERPAAQSSAKAEAFKNGDDVEAMLEKKAVASGLRAKLQDAVEAVSRKCAQLSFPKSCFVSLAYDQKDRLARNIVVKPAYPEHAKECAEEAAKALSEIGLDVEFDASGYSDTKKAKKAIVSDIEKLTAALG